MQEEQQRLQEEEAHLSRQQQQQQQVKLAPWAKKQQQQRPQESHQNQDGLTMIEIQKMEEERDREEKVKNLILDSFTCNKKTIVT